ncbi:MAG: hypothetical protein ACI4HI_18475 [Lachnospiraceae bacterium]
MILKNEYFADIKEYVAGLPEEEFTSRGTDKCSVLKNNDTMERLWIVYQKEVEEYGCDEEYALEDAVKEVLGTPIPKGNISPRMSEDKKMSYSCPYCGSKRFIGHQLIRADVYVGENGEFDGNLPGGLETSIYDSERPYGPFTCLKCDAEFDELPENRRISLPRGHFRLITDKKCIIKFKESGYGYSHEDNGYTVIGDGIRAVAISDADYDRYFGGARSFCL